MSKLLKIVLLYLSFTSASGNYVEKMSEIGRGIAEGANLSEKFLDDIIATWKLLSPTIIVQDDNLPDMCMTHAWVLCLKNDKCETFQQFSELPPCTYCL